MKVAHLTTVASSLRYLLLPQLLAVRDSGGEVVGISAPGPDVPFLEAAGIRHVPLPSSTRSMSVRADLRAVAELRAILRRERFDILHCHNPKPGLYGRVLGRITKTPIVVNTVHGLYATRDDPFGKRALIYSLETVASRFSDVELVQNPEDLEFMTRRRIIRPGKATLLGNGVDLRRFDADRWPAAERQAVRAELGLPADAVVVGTVGRLVREKGYVELFRAVRRLGSDVILLVVGPNDPEKDDALAPDVIAEAEAAGVRFLGHRTDVDRLYLAMDVFVLASHREGFPRAAMEAAAMGLPVVATDIRGCRQVVEDGNNGLLVPVGDDVALADALRRLTADGDLRRRMGAAGRTRARLEFDEDNVVAAVLDAYARAAAARGVTI